MAVASTASTSVPYKSTKRLRAPCLPRSRRLGSRPLSPPQSASKPIVMELWHSGASRSSARATRRSAPSVAIAPDNRLVARGIEAEWEKCLRELEKAEADFARREQLRPRKLNADERVR